jgi:hypothetical protein
MSLNFLYMNYELLTYNKIIPNPELMILIDYTITFTIK